SEETFVRRSHPCEKVAFESAIPHAAGRLAAREPSPQRSVCSLTSGNRPDSPHPLSSVTIAGTSAARAFHQGSAAPLDFTLLSRIINLFFTAQRCTERHPMDRLTRTFFANNVCLIALAIAGFASLSNLLLPAESVDSTSRGVVAWWTALCAVSVVNLGLWRLSAEALARRKGSVEPAVYRFQRWQLLLSAVYVLGCGFRSIVPRADVQRLGLFDSWVSSVMVGRSVATVAELCFMAQWALLLHKIARDAHCRSGVVVSWLL